MRPFLCKLLFLPDLICPGLYLSMKKTFISLARALCFLIVFFALLGGASGASPENPFRVAILYGTEHGNEYDIAAKQLGWEVTKYGHDKLDDLFRKLDQYDMVLACPLYAGNKHDVYAAHAKEWRSFLMQGGALVVGDTNYPSTVNWLESIDPSFSVSIESQGAFVPEALEESSPIHRVHLFPNKVLNPGAVWANLVIKPSSGWEVVTRRVSGAPVTAFQRLGKGFVYISNIRIPDAKRLEDLQSTLEMQRLGVVINKFSGIDVSVGKGELSMELKSISDSDLSVNLDLTITPETGEGISSSKSVVIKKGGEAQVSLPYHVSFRGPATVRLDLSANDRSTVLFAREIVLPDLLTVDSARYRGFLSKERRSDDVKLGISLVPDGEDISKLRLTTEVLDSNGKVVDPAREHGIPGNDFAISLPFSKSKYNVGSYVVRTKLLDGDKIIAEKSANLKVLNSIVRQTMIDEDMATLVGGKPFFPIGIYHVPQSDLRVVAAALGVNTVQAWWNRDIEKTKAYMDEARANNIRVILERGNQNEEDLVKIVNEFKNHVSLLAWYLVDEPGEDKKDIVNRVQALYEEHDENHPTFMVSYRPALFHQEQEYADIFAVDPYIKDTPKALYRPVTKISDWISGAWTATKGDKPVWAVTESFGFATPEECRITTYLSIIHQAKAVIWYPWDDGKIGGGYYGLKYYPELYPVFRQMVVELEALAPGLLDGKLRTFVEGPFHGLVVEHKDGNSLLLANTSQGAENASFHVPELKGAS